MFRSTVQNLITPQFEHSRLAGMLAWHWGNAQFDRPALDFAGFAQGVALHDWHYGMLDNHPLGAYDHDEWLAIADRGVSTDYADAVTDVVAKFHLRRLIGAPEDEQTRSLVERLEDKIEARIEKSPYSEAAFDWADRITRFCDGVAFHFGFEHHGWHAGSVGAQVDAADETEIAYEIAADGTICFDPWPFAVAEFCELVTAFDADGYPERLEPRLIRARCVPRS